MVNLNLDEDTEFRDALRQHGIIPPAPPTPPSPSAFLPSDADLLAATLSLADPSTLHRMAEETVDSDEERLFESYRQTRLKEMQVVEKKARFGRMLPIGRSDWEREVTLGSSVNEKEEEGMNALELGGVMGAESEDEESEDEETGKAKIKKNKGEGTGVVCFLYKDGQPASTRLGTILSALAAKFPRTKFISIIGSQCIENYPDRNLPTLIVYRNGDVTQQIVGADGILGKGAERDIQQLLVATKAILPSHLPTMRSSSRSDSEPESDEEWGGLRKKAGEKSRTTKGGASTGIRNGGVGIGTGKGSLSDSGDDFDL